MNVNIMDLGRTFMCLMCLDPDAEEKPQTLLFSATCPSWVYDVAKKYMRSQYMHVDLIGKKTQKTATTVEVKHYSFTQFGTAMQKMPLDRPTIVTCRKNDVSIDVHSAECGLLFMFGMKSCDGLTCVFMACSTWLSPVTGLRERRSSATSLRYTVAATAGPSSSVRPRKTPQSSP